MASFEYKILTTNKPFLKGTDRAEIEPILEEMGRNSWELVSVVPISTMAAGTTTTLQYFFKRKRP